MKRNNEPQEEPRRLTIVELQEQSNPIRPTAVATPMMRIDRGLIYNLQAGYKHTLKPDAQQQVIFAELEAKTQSKIIDLHVDQSHLYFGIDMGEDGWVLMNLLWQLQYKQSNTTNQSRLDYYLGRRNTSPFTLTEWMGEQMQVGYIETTLGEMTRIRTGNQRPSKKQINVTRALLMKYNMRRYLYKCVQTYTKTTKNGNKKAGSRYRETYTILYKADISADADSRTSVVKIWLSPAFYSRIKNNYDTLPVDFYDRVRDAYCSIANIKSWMEPPEYLFGLLHQLADAQLYPDCVYHIKARGTEKDKGLYDKMSPYCVSKRMWKELEKRLDMYVEVAKRIGLLVKHWKTTNNDGEEVLYFQVVPQGQWK